MWSFKYVFEVQKQTNFESKESLHFVHFANYSVPSTLFFLLQLYNFLFVFVVSTREKRSNAMNSKKQNEIKFETSLKYLVSICT